MDKHTEIIRAFEGNQFPSKARINTDKGFVDGAEPGDVTRFTFRSSKRKGFIMKQEQAIEQIDLALDELQQSLAAGDSKQLTRYLKMMGNFHNYSFGNLILILTQCPEATQVAGYKTWQNKFGRQVKKGEKGIRILAPLIGKKQADESDGDEPERRVFGFRVVSVFDISQTEGDELPGIGTYQGEVSDYLEKLETFTMAKGIELHWESPDGGALGVSKGGTILVDPTLDAPVKFATLTHEVAHELLHRTDRREQTDRSIRETEAEAVAFAVCEAVGISSNGHAENYIKLHQGDAEKLKASLDYIRVAASEILAALHNDHVKETTGSLVG